MIVADGVTRSTIGVLLGNVSFEGSVARWEGRYRQEFYQARDLAEAPYFQQEKLWNRLLLVSEILEWLHGEVRG